MRSLLLVLFAVGAAGCSPEASSFDLEDTTPDPGLPSEANGQRASLLSAFFGLDNDLPMLVNRICRGGNGLDGMPVIFSTEIDHKTMQAGDFQVTKASGEIGEMHCVSLLPAADAGELRTALLIGEFGNSGEDPPATVEIIGHVTSIDGAIDFKGASVAVTPLKEGPTLVFAESVSEEAADEGLGIAQSTGSSCAAGTPQAIRAVWAGGVSLSSGEDLGEEERLLYTVIVEASDGSRREIAPAAIADHMDPDNNHLLCLDTADPAISVSYPAGVFVDPNNDLNPATSTEVSR